MRPSQRFVAPTNPVLNWSTTSIRSSPPGLEPHFSCLVKAKPSTLGDLCDLIYVVDRQILRSILTKKRRLICSSSLWVLTLVGSGQRKLIHQSKGRPNRAFILPSLMGT